MRHPVSRPVSQNRVRVEAKVLPDPRPKLALLSFAVLALVVALLPLI
jgi:hypothetical protein